MTRKQVRRSAFERPTRPEQLPPPPPAAPPPRVAPALDPERPPTAVRLTSPFAYLDDSGTMHGWLAGQIVGEREVVAALIRRGAPLAAIERGGHVGEPGPGEPESGEDVG